MEDEKSFSINREKGAIIAVAIVLIIAASTIAVYFAYNAKTTNTGYHTFYLLDMNSQAENYPEVLVVNQNNTFSVNATVENHKTAPQDYEVRVKITQEALSFPVNTPVDSTYQKTGLSNQDKQNTWIAEVTVTINELGDYAVVFELWAKNTDTSDYVFTDNFCILNIQVISD